MTTRELLVAAIARRDELNVFIKLMIEMLNEEQLRAVAAALSPASPPSAKEMQTQ